IIGLGSSGTTVYQIPSSPNVLKTGSCSSIWQDFRLTKRVYDATEHAMTWRRHPFCGAYEEWQVPSTPYAMDFYREDHDFVGRIKDRLPLSHRDAPRSMFVTERIPPVAKEARDALIELYFDTSDAVQEAAKADPDNNDCLVRIYLGERESREEQCCTSLRNFPLRLNMIQDIGLDVDDLATSMAIGLAIIHWECQVDALGVEFVLGGSRRGKDTDDDRPEDYSRMDMPPREVIASSDKEPRRSQMWMLGFGKASTFALTKEEVTTRLVPAFLGNDPYYPRPGVEAGLWEIFREAYVEASKQLTCLSGGGDRFEELCQFFVDEVVRVVKEDGR
ncbi:MAG: hypothetical protein Q9170_006684, partial [Blastenia crenularia]